MKAAGISVIVCCFNSAARIELTLRHLLNQELNTGLNWEIIVIDNRSTDDTANLATELLQDQAGPIDWKVVNENEPGLTNARNKGFEEARFNIVLMVDDDNSLAPDYVQGIWNSFQNNPKVGMVGGTGIAALESEPPAWFKQYDYCYAIGPQSDGKQPVEHLYGAGLALRMDLLEKLRNAGFRSLLTDRVGNSLMSGGDTELCFAFRLAGYELVHRHDLTFTHHLPSARVNWKYLRRLFSGFGHTKAYMELYTSAVSGRPFPTQGKLPFWLDRAIYLGKNLIPDLPILLLGSFIPMEGNGKLLKALAKLAQIRRIMTIKAEYYDMFKQVYSLRDTFRA
jgi:glycosyltransferase involved in cell wall biosynthesis